MGYDDRFYYGQAKITVKCAGYDGKVISLAKGSKYYTNTLADGQCTFTVPGTDRYDISLINGTEVTSKGSVAVSYGQCKTITV